MSVIADACSSLTWVNASIPSFDSSAASGLHSGPSFVTLSGNRPWITSRERAGLAPNTVQLGAWGSGDTATWWASGLWPRPMSGSFDVPLHVLALDDPRIAPSPTGRVEPSPEQGDGVSPAVVRLSRGKNRGPATEIERRAMRSAATKLTRSGSTRTQSAASHMRVRMA